MSVATQPRAAPPDEAAAEQILRAFGRMRSAAIDLRRRGDRESAAEIEQIAWELVEGSAPVKASYARARLGISDPTLRKWVARGILERTAGQPLRVTLASLARAEIQAARVHTGRGMTETVEKHLRWERMAEAESFQRALRNLSAATTSPPDAHRSAERRSLALHRAIAERLDERSLTAARARVRRWLKQGGPVDPATAGRWGEILGASLAEVRKAIVQDSEAMRDLRQSSPFAGVLTEPERHRILRESA